VRVEGRGESPYDLVTTRTSSHPSVATLEQNPGRLGVVFLGAGAVNKLPDVPADTLISLTMLSMAQSYEDLNGNRRFDAGSEQRGNYAFSAAIEQAARQAASLSTANETPEKGKDASSSAPAANAVSAPMRAVVVGDADFVGNGIVRNPGNAYFVLDAIKWLAGDEQSIGTVESEKDVPLVHRKDEDAIVFYGTSFLIPAAVLFGGFMMTRRPSRARRSG
jgi:biotin carboxyl carrier protein